MSKARFTSLDVRCEANDLRRKLVGLRVANVYDMNKKSYLLKLVKPDFKTFLVIESGIRLHSTQYSREKNEVPSVFAMKLRKYIRTRRLEAVEQWGLDRLVDLTFGQGDLECHLILELYAGGNIVLTDKQYRVITLLRSYSLDDGTNVAVGATYPRDIKQKLELISAENLQSIISGGDKKKGLKNILSMKIPYGNEFIEHCLLVSDIDPRTKPANFDMAKVAVLKAQLDKAYHFLTSMEASKGYIVSEKPKEPAKDDKGGKGEKTDGKDEKETESEEGPKQSANMQLAADGTRYSDFLPLLFRQFQSKKDENLITEFRDFDTAVDEYFSKIYAQKVEVEKVEQERTVDSKLAKVRQDQQARIDALVNQEKKLERHALLIEQNIDMVDRCIMAVNASLAQQVDWDRLAEHIKEEQNNGDPVAGMIHKLKLKENKISLLLFDTFLVDEDDLTLPSEVVDVDLSLTAHANSTNYFADKKRAYEKRLKTISQGEKALESAEKKAEQKMKETKLIQSVKQIRKPYWFEKFYFFISSENHIIIAGRDAQQNEILYRRYLQANDIYLHADLHGASSVIIKRFNVVPNSDPESPVPPSTLQQAATFALCHSAAWKNKVLASTYWVNANQVSKTAPTGEYLNTGGFMIRGKKNALNPTQMVLGLALLFRVADESVVNHVDERKPKVLNTSGAFDDSGASISSKNEKGEAQPKHWEPKKKPLAEEKVQKSAEDDDEDFDEEELRNSDFSIKLVRDEPSLGGSSEIKAPQATPEPAKAPISASKTHKSSNQRTEPKKSAKKKLSAKERRLLKKKQSQKSSEQTEEPDENRTNEEDNNEDVEYNEDNEGEEEDEESDSDEEEDLAKQKGPVPVQYKRGQKAKAKKMKEKYAWQDEDDRKLHMKMLGHKVEDNDEGEPANEDKGGKSPNSDSQGTLEGDKRPKESRKDQKKQKEAEDEEIRELLREEKVDLLSDDQKARIDELTAQMSGVNLSALTGRPLPSDILLYALPVCGPYEALKDYKYKVKIVPGADKKGKARSILNMFLAHPEATTQERDLVRAVPEPEILNTLIADCKLHAPGAHTGGQKGKKK